MACDDDDDYKVGYGRPPLHSRFKKGQSGNPNGRPRGRKSLAAIVDAAFNKPVTVTENGRRRTMTKGELAIAQLVNRAAGGDHRATKFLLDLKAVVDAVVEEGPWAIVNLPPGREGY